jgi:hypothetical protein
VQVPGRATPVVQTLCREGLCLVPVALFLAFLFSLSYTCRKSLKSLPACALLFACAFVLSFGSTLGLRAVTRLSANPARQGKAPAIASPGLILQAGNVNTVLLGEPADPGAARVVALPGRGLLYETEPPASEQVFPPLPSLPFSHDKPGFISNLNADLILDGGRLGSLSLPALALYLAALCFLLASCRFVFHLAVWPLANLILGGILYRGILVMETWLDSAGIQQALAQFFHNLIPGLFLSPLVFTFLGVLACMLGAVLNASQKLSRGSKN